MKTSVNSPESRVVFRVFAYLIIFLMLILFFVLYAASMSRAEYKQKISDLSVSRSDAEGLKWELKADEARVYGNGEQAKLRQINLHYFLVPGHDVFMRGDNADVDFSANRISMQGNIKAESQQGVTLETETLIWHGAQRSISTQDRVIIKRADLEIYGKGLEADLDLEKIKIKADAKTVIYY